MNYILVKIYTAVFGINKVLAVRSSGGNPGSSGGFPGTGTTGSQGGDFTIPNPLGVESISQIINNIAYALSVYIAPPLVTLMILFAAFQILTAGDNPEKLKTGREIILWTCVGYGIILISWGITSIIQQLLSGH